MRGRYCLPPTRAADVVGGPKSESVRVTGVESNIGESRIKHKVIVIQIYFRRYRQYHVSLFFFVFFFFFSGICRCETDIFACRPHQEKFLLGSYR